MVDRKIVLILISSIFGCNSFYLPIPKCKSPSLQYFDDISRYMNIDEFLDEDELIRRRLDAKAALDKMKMMKEHILGYNAKSAMHLKRKKINKLTRKWMRKSGTVGKLEGDELFNDLAGIKVCSQKNIIGCIAFLWRTIVNDILHEDPQDHSRSVYMVVFPYCHLLYSYEEHVLLNQIIDLGSDLCSYLGTDYSLTMFHPHYKNSPKMFSPERHSPFPTSGLRFQPNPKDSYDDDELTYGGNSLYLESQKLSLERIFNSAAASAPNNYGEPEYNLQELSGEEARRLKVPLLEQGLVLKITKQWFDEDNQFNATANSWFVSKATCAEEAYADTWGIIYQLYKLQQEQQEQNFDEEITAATLVAPGFNKYNFPQWRKFAITINAVLKRVKQDPKITLELFHPEYAGKNDSERSDFHRRTPFPTLQIICQKN